MTKDKAKQQVDEAIADLGDDDLWCDNALDMYHTHKQTILTALRHFQASIDEGWNYNMDEAPRDAVHAGADTGKFIKLKINENGRETVGYWHCARGCFRYEGDDGWFDVQPTAWKPLSTKSDQILKEWMDAEMV